MYFVHKPFNFFESFCRPGLIYFTKVLHKSFCHKKYKLKYQMSKQKVPTVQSIQQFYSSQKISSLHQANILVVEVDQTKYHFTKCQIIFEECNKITEDAIKDCFFIVRKKMSEELQIGYCLFTDGFPTKKNHLPIFAQKVVPLKDVKEITALEDKLVLKTKNISWQFRFKQTEVLNQMWMPFLKPQGKNIYFEEVQNESISKPKDVQSKPKDLQSIQEQNLRMKKFIAKLQKAFISYELKNSQQEQKIKQLSDKIEQLELMIKSKQKRSKIKICQEVVSVSFGQLNQQKREADLCPKGGPNFQQKQKELAQIMKGALLEKNDQVDQLEKDLSFQSNFFALCKQFERFFLNLEYPYSCMVRVESTGYIPIQPHNKHFYHGVGTLISRDLVLTCAHNIYFFSNTLRQRVMAKQVWIELGNRKVKVKDFRFPEQFKMQYDRYRQFDFALLLLEEQIDTKGKYLRLAYDCQEKVLTGMFKRNTTKPGGQVQLNCQYTQASRSGIITHSHNTERGEAGTPLIIQPDKGDKQCYLIAFHYGKAISSSSTQENKAVKITSKIVQTLAEFERNMKKNLVSVIESSSWQYGKNRSSSIKSKEEEDIQWKVNKKFDEFKRVKWLNARNASKELRKGAQQFLKYNQEMNQIKTSIFGNGSKDVSEEKFNKYRELQAEFKKYVNRKQTIPLFNQLKFFCYALITSVQLLPLKQNQSKWDYILDFMESIEQYSEYLLHWDALISLYKQHDQQNLFSALQVEFLFPKKHLQYIEADLVQQKIWQIIGLKMKTRSNHQIELTFNSYRLLAKLQPAENNKIKRKMQCQLPFISLQQTAIYSKDEWFQWQLQIAFENKKQLNQIFWNLIRFRHPLQGTYVVYERVYERSSLKTTFGKNSHLLKIEQCYSQQFFTLEVVVHWIEQIVEFVTALHQQGFTLGIPIERCLFISVLEMKKCLTILQDKGIPVDQALEKVLRNHPPSPFFFYFQSIQALQYQCSVLGLADRKKEEEFIPFDEILNGSLTKKKAELIDVWMLGMWFKRMFARLYLQNQQSKQIPPSIIKIMAFLVMKTTCRIDQRIYINQIDQLLKEMRQVIKNEVKLGNIKQ